MCPCVPVPSETALIWNISPYLCAREWLDFLQDDAKAAYERSLEEQRQREALARQQKREREAVAMLER